jgi:hypothetical protein
VLVQAEDEQSFLEQQYALLDAAKKGLFPKDIEQLSYCYAL